MDRSTALQLAADEMQERELRYSSIEIIDYVPTDISRRVLAPVGSVTVYVAREGASILDRVRAAALDRSGSDVDLAEELDGRFRGRERMSYYHAYRLLKASPSFATIRYGGRTLATNIFPPPGPELVALENPYNGGRLQPNELTLVEHRLPGSSQPGLAAIALRHAPPLTDYERAALEQVPEDQLEMNLDMHAECCDNWTDFAQVVIAVTFAVLTFIAARSPEELAPLLSEEQVRQLGPAASARQLLIIRRELLGHDHA